MMDQDYSEEEGEETYIDPNDLNIITNDFNWEPLDEDIINYARQLGFDIENDPQEFLEIAYNYLKKPLPKGWKRAFQKANGELLYIDMSTNEIHLSTQLEEMAKEEYLMNKKEYEQRQRAEEEAKKKVIVIPRTKIPPIGAKKPKENQNQIKEKEFIQRLAKEKEEEDLLKQKEEIKVIKSQIEKKKNDNENGEVIYPIYNADNNNSKNVSLEKDNDLQKSDEVGINRPRKHCYQPEVYEDLNVHNNFKKEESYTSTPNKNNQNRLVSVSPGYVTPERLSKKQDDIKLQIPLSSMSIEKKKSIEESTIDNLTQKQEYLKYQQEELKRYKHQLKVEYGDQKQLLNHKYNDKYEKELIREKRILKDNFKTTTTMNVSYESKYHQDIEDYKQSMKLIADIKYNEKEYIEKKEKELNDLQSKKEDLVKSIKIQKENNKIQRERRIKNIKEQIQKEIKFSDERIKIQKDSLLQKSIANISTIEMKYDTQLKQQKDNINLSQSMSFGKLIKIPTTFFNKQCDSILQAHEKLLEESFQIKKREIENEFYQTKEKEIEEQRKISLNDTHDKINLVNKEINELEKDYYYELNSIRSKAKIIKDRNIKSAKEQLNDLSNSFEQLKNYTLNITNVKIQEIVNLLQEAIRLSQGNDIIYSAESKFEEGLMLKLGEANVLYKKSKTIYILTERDFKQKHILLMYFYDIANFLSKKLIERPLNQTHGNRCEDILKEQTDEFIKALFDYGRETINKYQTKYRTCQNTILFPFLDIITYKTSNANPSNHFTQLMYQDKQMSDQFRNESSFIGSFEKRDNKQDEQFSPHQFSNEKRDLNNHSIKVFPIHTYRDQTERYPNFGLSQHDIIRESEENQLNQSAQFNTKDNQNVIETTHLSKSINLVNSKLINQQEQSFTQYQQPISMEKSYLFKSNYVNYDPIPIPSIPEEIKAKLSEEEFSIYSTINDFLRNEEAILLKQENDVVDKRTVFDQLTQFNEKGYLLQISNDIYLEKIQIVKLEKEYKDKVSQYNIIKNLINNTFNFITSNSTRTNFIKGKLLSVIKHIEKYYNNNNQEKEMLFNIIPIPKQQENYEQPEQHSVCMCNSKSNQNMFRKTHPNEPINIGTIHNQFTNFYSLYRPNTLSQKINTNFSHEFFNFKKNTEYVNYKLASTRYSGISDISKRQYYI